MEMREFIQDGFYRTRNGSKVRFVGRDAGGHPLFRVIIGGHRNPMFWGEKVGEAYSCMPNGEMCVPGMGIKEPWEEASDV